MAVECVIGEATRDAAGTVHLKLEPLPGAKHGPEGNLMLHDAPPNFEAVVGTRICVSSLRVTVAGVEWATRHGASRIRLVAPKKLRGGCP